MIEIFGRNWGIVLIRGIVSLIFGIYIIVGHPAVGLATWILVYGVFLVVTGVFVWINSFLTRRYEPSWLEFILNGPLRVAIGIVTLAWPAVDRSMDASTVLHIVGAWSVFRGVGHIVSGVQLRRLLRGMVAPRCGDNIRCVRHSFVQSGGSRAFRDFRLDRRMSHIFRDRMDRLRTCTAKMAA